MNKHKKKNLLEDLKYMRYYAEESINRMREIYGEDFDNAFQLEGAMKMVQQWEKELFKEIRNESGTSKL
jgi:hypothetical protein